MPEFFFPLPLPDLYQDGLLQWLRSQSLLVQKMSGLTDLTDKATPVDADEIWVADSEDSGTNKKISLGNLPNVHQGDLISEATMWGVDFRIRGLGVDSGDQWTLRSQGDDFTMSQWDDSATAWIDRFTIIGKGTTVTDEGDILFFDVDGAEFARWDQSATRMVFAGTTGIVLPVKTDTGDPSSPAEGQLYVNTFDNKIRVYADAAWRDLATW